MQERNSPLTRCPAPPRLPAQAIFGSLSLFGAFWWMVLAITITSEPGWHAFAMQCPPPPCFPHALCQQTAAYRRLTGPNPHAPSPCVFGSPRQPGHRCRLPGHRLSQWRGGAQLAGGHPLLLLLPRRRVRPVSCALKLACIQTFLRSLLPALTSPCAEACLRSDLPGRLCRRADLLCCRTYRRPALRTCRTRTTQRRSKPSRPRTLDLRIHVLLSASPSAASPSAATALSWTAPDPCWTWSSG